MTKELELVKAIAIHILSKLLQEGIVHMIVDLELEIIIMRTVTTIEKIINV